MTGDPLPLPVVDLRDRIALGLARGASLLHAEERAVAERVLGLEGAPALLLARLSGRRVDVFRVPDLIAAGVDDVPGALAALASIALVDDELSWTRRAEVATREVLAQGCAALGLSQGGRRAELAARLDGHEDWDEAPWVRLVAAPILLRLERMGTLQVRPDRSSAVLARMGRLRWPDYPTTGLSSLLPDRAAWDRWEALVDLDGAPPVEAALDALAWPAWPPGGLDRRDALGHDLREHARAEERAGRLEEAADLWARLESVGQGGRDHVVRRARCVERAGRVEEALSLLEEGRDAGDGAARIAVARAGRRVAASLGRAWVPDPPLATPVRRTLRLDRVADGGRRPRYRVDGHARLVEDAVVACLARQGRRAVHGEGSTWSTLGALVFADALFAPVPGQLPVPFLTGPLDGGTPAFAARRPGLVQALLDRIDAGEAPALVAQGWARLEGALVAGVSWDLATRDELVGIAAALGPAGLRAVLVPWLRWGWRALGGLPDLVVLDGPEVRVDGLHPGAVPSGVHLVEVKGEQDSLRDAQRVWLDRFARAGVSAEVWWIVGGPGAAGRGVG
ncbi:MAG: VRR-NUC domain-containing protein [Alphaproteobacteria bacterium]|nr:VRR-NUC domain-containing protein [Alphaproteobacteria bacterium]